MTQLATPSALETDATTDPRAWRWAGGLALAHIVLLFAGFSQEVAVEHGISLAKLQDSYGSANMTRVFAGGYVESMSFLVLVPALVLIARLLGRGTEAARVASQTFLGLGIAFVSSTLAVGFAPGAAAVYAAHHGVDIGSIALMNDLRNYGFILQVALLAGMTLALGIATVLDRVHTRWIGWGGVTVGSVGLVVTPFAQNAVSMAWMIWWVGLAVLLLRGAPRTPAERSLPND